MNAKGYSWMIGIIGGTGAALVTIVQLWPVFGWITPAQAEREHTASEQIIKDFRDEWKCDEYDEELYRLREELADAQRDDVDTTEIEHEIDKLERKMDKIDCSRFEDFG